MNMVDKMLSELYEEFRAMENNGALANYIPELSKVNPGNFGIVLTTVDGYQYSYGDSEIEFTIQSVSKPFIYGMAIQEHGVKKSSGENKCRAKWRCFQFNQSLPGIR